MMDGWINWILIVPSLVSTFSLDPYLFLGIASVKMLSPCLVLRSNIKRSLTVQAKIVMEFVVRSDSTSFSSIL